VLKSRRYAQLHDRMCELIDLILVRAQTHGSARADITKSDIIDLNWANDRIMQATADIAPRAWRRHLGLMIDAFRAGGGQALPEPPMTDDQLTALWPTSAAKRYAFAGRVARQTLWQDD